MRIAVLSAIVIIFVCAAIAHRPKIAHAQVAGVWKTVVANLKLIFITIGAFKYPILTINASPIVADFHYVVYNYFTQIINVTDILLQFCLGSNLIILDYVNVCLCACMYETIQPHVQYYLLAWRPVLTRLPSQHHVR